MFYAIVFDLIRQFIPKIYLSIGQKKSNRLVDVVFEICLDKNFQSQEKYWKMSTITRNFINYFKSFN